MKPNLGDLVLIKWLDSATPADRSYWQDKATHARIAKCQSAGWVVHAGKNTLALAQTQSPDQNGGLISIPRIAITKMKRLR